ncbi:MAG: hypothetical protein QGG17_09975 [Rhodospirillales bacterium]|jgi:hypothetical protein|nr:hypothetical protein [Rhodospirillales bacterium]MDP6804606.1 hypothetical protein [Rhodospirillales bacterium]
MIWPPSMVRVRIYENGRRKLNLWLPVCVLWPPVILIALLLAPAPVAVLWLAAGKGRRRGAVMAGPLLFRLFCAIRGFYFEAGNPGNGIRMAVY